MLKCVLTAPPRAGKKNKVWLESYTRSRLESWIEGERFELWDSSYKPKDRGKSTPPSASSKKRRVLELAEEDLFGQASKALTSKGVLGDSVAAVKVLVRKHPQGQQVPWPVGLRGRQQLSVITTEVLAALNCFPRNSAGGPSG